MTKAADLSALGSNVTTAGNLSSNSTLTLQTNSTTAITVDSSQRAAFVAGTVALPAITTAGDTNTGIFFPAADTIAFAEGGTETMRLDSSGNVGIGTTAPSQKLTISSNTVLPSAGAPNTSNIWSVGADASANVTSLDSFGNITSIISRRANGTAASPSALLSGDSIFQFAGRGYGATGYSSAGRANLIFAASENWSDTAQGTYIAFNTTTNTTTTTAERMRIDSAGNVGIGTGSPSTWGKFAVVGASSGGQVVAAIANTSGTANTQAVLSLDTTNAGFNVRDSQIRARNNGLNQTTLEFYTADAATPTERMRIHASGGVSIGNTTDPGGANLSVSGTVTASSDARLKENVKEISNALDKVNAIRGVTYTRNDMEDKERLYTGVIAQEIEAVLPEAVFEGEDGIKSVAYGNMVGLLIEAIKELKKEIDELKGK